MMILKILMFFLDVFAQSKEAMMRMEHDLSRQHEALDHINQREKNQEIELSELGSHAEHLSKERNQMIDECEVIL
jgi:hypothetical protein